MLADKVSKLKFLVDTGADVSVLPKHYAPKADSSNELLLLAANGTKIATFGKKRLTLDLNLPRNFTWSFIIANVNQPIIGLDFLKHYNLLVDVKSGCLIDGITKLTTQGKYTNTDSLTSGVQKIKTTPYHPKSNGIVERFHRSLKQSLRCHAPTKWTESIPLVLLRLRTALKEDLQCPSAELVYGSTLRLPAEFFETPSLNVDPHEFLKNLRAVMDQLKPVATTSHGNKIVFLYPALETCSHVFVRHDAVKKLLQTPYDGPYLVLKRTEKMFIIEQNGKQSTINIDRLKPAFFENSHHSSAPTISPPPVAVPTSTKPVPGFSPLSPVPPTNSTPLPYVTRSGRRVRFNSHYF
ncbi:pro-Pol polyprotein [Trichonephila clavata]|uniref:Pro-Pol polyprotein n=1 Tax=Trichonephila clavata TaxID=2740835 RepID=A0A8X6EXH3_TRICU|nr:pro-Pol polyprotein [Trichonephila clavata]